MMQLDDVVPSTTTGPRVEEAMMRSGSLKGRTLVFEALCEQPDRRFKLSKRPDLFRSVRWLDRCLQANKRPSEQNLFPIVQGGLDLDLRRRCAEGLRCVVCRLCPVPQSPVSIVCREGLILCTSAPPLVHLACCAFRNDEKGRPRICHWWFEWWRGKTAVLEDGRIVCRHASTGQAQISNGRWVRNLYPFQSIRCSKNCSVTEFDLVLNRIVPGNDFGGGDHKHIVSVVVNFCQPPNICGVMT